MQKRYIHTFDAIRFFFFKRLIFYAENDGVDFRLSGFWANNISSFSIPYLAHHMHHTVIYYCDINVNSYFRHRGLTGSSHLSSSLRSSTALQNWKYSSIWLYKMPPWSLVKESQREADTFITKWWRWDKKTSKNK